MGQDPYPGYEKHGDKIIPHACGLSFSVSERIKKLPGSLRNIFKELENSLPDWDKPTNGSLYKWVKNEKVLLLNSSLTTIVKKPGSHMKLWTEWTDGLIEWLSDNCSGIVFLLMGNFAKRKSLLIDTDKHFVFKTVHPSPLSANRGFFNCNVFPKINKTLKEANKTPIDLSLV